jgi:ankyrin repeat protein
MNPILKTADSIIVLNTGVARQDPNEPVTIGFAKERPQTGVVPLQRGSPKISQVDRFRRIQFFLNIDKGDVDACRLFLEEQPEMALHTLDGNEETTLHKAVGSKNSTSALVDLFLDRGADINKKCLDGRTPIMMAIRRDGSFDVFLHLLRRGADHFGKDIDDTRRHSTLHEAAEKSQNEMLQVLIDRSPPEWIENLASKGKRPLHSAAFIGNALGCKKLIRAGANPNVQGGLFMRTPLTMAAHQNNTENSHLKTVFTLIALGADPKEKGLEENFWTNHTPEMAAAAAGDTELLMDMKQGREAQGRPFSAQEIDRMACAAEDQKELHMLAFLQSLRASDFVDDVMRTAARPHP